MSREILDFIESSYEEYEQCFGCVKDTSECPYCSLYEAATEDV